MNAVEIEAALSELAALPFEAQEFPFAFLAAFGNKETTLKRLRRGDSNSSDIPGAVLQRNHIHICVAAPGTVSETLTALRGSPRTGQAKAKYALATDGTTLEAEDLAGGETIACEYSRFPDYFGFFLPLAGIATVKEIKDNPVDVRATGRLNKLYIELLRTNPEWATAERRADMNHFMARLIFCLFAEDTDIFAGDATFTRIVDQLSERDASNTHEVLGTLFRAMSLSPLARKDAGLPRWAESFPYVNGGLFDGSTDVPRFTRTARSYLFQAGQLDWKAINPDIFGSMIQAVADDEERGSLGLHYTSVPNILKVLNPLFLDDLNAQLAAAGDNKAKLLHLRKRLARIRVFDPACGSGNFLVIAYKQLRAIEAEVNRRRGEPDRRTDIPLTNFRGIELRDFPAEIARLALIIAEFQCDVVHRGQQEALSDVVPLDSENWIICANALRLDWLSIVPASGTSVKLVGDDLFSTPLDQAEIDFANEGGETYICGNPPYLGKGKKGDQHLEDMDAIFGSRTDKYGYIDYVGCWFALASDYCRQTGAVAAFVATNSVCQGRQLPQLWPVILRKDIEIVFAHHSFKWANSAARNAGVMCVIVGIAPRAIGRPHVLIGGDFSRSVSRINAYLIEGDDTVVESRPQPLSTQLARMQTGSVPNDGGHLILDGTETQQLCTEYPAVREYVHPYLGSEDFLHGLVRNCLVIDDSQVAAARQIPPIATRLDAVSRLRSSSKKKETREQLSKVPHRFQHRGDIPRESAIIIPSVSSERRSWFPCGLLGAGSVVSNLAFMILDAPLWQLALLASRIHLVWIETVCGKLKNDYRYSNTLGWNTFPVPTITELNQVELVRCAEDILLAREAHYPATVAELYDPATMPEDLRRAHDRNDEVVERIYVGRRFKNDTERLEKLFAMFVGQAGRRQLALTDSGKSL